MFLTSIFERTRGNAFELKESRFRLAIMKKFFPGTGYAGKLRLLHPWKVQDQAEQGSQSLGLMENVPTHGRGFQIEGL